MTLQTLVLTAEVPDDQTVAAQAAAASLVQTFLTDVEGSAIVAATFGGASLLPSAADAFAAALENVRQVTSKSPRASAADVEAAMSALDAAAKVLEAVAAPAAPVADPAAPAAVDPATAAAVVPAPTGEEAPPAPPAYSLPDVPPAPDNGATTDQPAADPAAS